MASTWMDEARKKAARKRLKWRFSAPAPPLPLATRDRDYHYAHGSKHL